MIQSPWLETSLRQGLATWTPSIWIEVTCDIHIVLRYTICKTFVRLLYMQCEQRPSIHGLPVLNALYVPMQSSSFGMLRL